MQHERLQATVRGQVQGVGFRWFVVRHASGMGLTGWARNEPDGSVQVVAEGPPQVLTELLARLHEGPPASAVREVESSRSPATGEFRRFSVASGAHRGD